METKNKAHLLKCVVKTITNIFETSIVEELRVFICML